MVAVPLVLSYGAGKFFWEVAKKTKAFKETTDQLATKYDESEIRLGEEASRQQIALLQKMERFVQRRRPLIEQVASMRPEFGWVRRYLKSGAIEKVTDSEAWKLSQHIVLLTLPGEEHTEVGIALAKRLGVQWFNHRLPLSSDKKAKARSIMVNKTGIAYGNSISKYTDTIANRRPGIVELTIFPNSNKTVLKQVGEIGTPVLLSGYQEWSNILRDLDLGADQLFRVDPLEYKSTDDVVDAILAALRSRGYRWFL
ncbi:MAG: hypothetical protein AAFX81_18035 [Pseudomonadota bacterium]